MMWAFKACQVWHMKTSKHYTYLPHSRPIPPGLIVFTTRKDSQLVWHLGFVHVHYWCTTRKNSSSELIIGDEWRSNHFFGEHPHRGLRHLNLVYLVFYISLALQLPFSFPSLTRVHPELRGHCYSSNFPTHQLLECLLVVSVLYDIVKVF